LTPISSRRSHSEPSPMTVTPISSRRSHSEPSPMTVPDDWEFDRPERDDHWALEVLHKCLGVDSGTALQGYERAQRNEALRTLKAKGLTIRQIERLMGINRNIVQKA